MFISALIDVAGHAGKLDAAFEILQAARVEGVHAGIVAYSSLMGACRNVCSIDLSYQTVSQRLLVLPQK